MCQAKPHTVRSTITAEDMLNAFSYAVSFGLPLQPERSGSIDSALLGLRYLNSLSSIAANHSQEDAGRYEGGPKHLEEHELDHAGLSQYGCAPALPTPICTLPSNSLQTFM